MPSFDLDTGYERDLLSDAPAAEARVPAFYFDYSCDQFRLGPFGPNFRRLGAKSNRYLRFTKARWNAMSVAGFSTMAERSKRAGGIRPAHRLAMMRSMGCRFGARARDPFKINS